MTRRLLESTEDSLSSQVINSSTRWDEILDLMVINTSEPIGDVRTGGSLGCSDYAVQEFEVLRDMGQMKSNEEQILGKQTAYCSRS